MLLAWEAVVVALVATVRQAAATGQAGSGHQDLATLPVEGRVQQVAHSPRIFTVDDFLSNEECDFFRRLGEPHLQYASDQSSVWTGSWTHVSKNSSREHPLISAVIRRMYRLARVPLGHGEQLHIVRYLPGEECRLHHDSDMRAGVMRPATIITYLSDVEAGGETLFPMNEGCQPLRNCCAGVMPASDMLRYSPKKGRALLFYSHDPSGVQSAIASHGGCPVEKGEKWIVQALFRSHLHPDSPHYDFEHMQPGDLDAGLVLRGPRVTVDQAGALAGKDRGPHTVDAPAEDHAQLVIELISALSALARVFWVPPVEGETAAAADAEVAIAELPPGARIRLNSFQGHVLHVRDGDGGALVQRIEVGAGPLQQYTIGGAAGRGFQEELPEL